MINKELDKAYEAANQDPDRLEVLGDWSASDDMSDLMCEDDWDWLRFATEKGE